jgi:TrpR-related protein YerC/YecD
MARFDPKRISHEGQQELLKHFWQAVTLVESYDESQTFLRDLLHPQEVLMFARRIQIAKMLREGFNFEEIGLLLRTSPTTIVKINRALDHGHGGLAAIVDKLLEREREEAKPEQRQWNPLSWESIQRRYALYFWPARLLEQLQKQWQELQRVKRKQSSIPPRSNQ